MRGYGFPHSCLRSGAARRIGPMCGRFTATFVEPQMIAARFAISAPAIPAETLGRYNVCPTEQVLAVVSDDGSERAARDLRWGLVPPWARKLRAGPEPINAR